MTSFLLLFRKRMLEFDMNINEMHVKIQSTT